MHLKYALDRTGTLQEFKEIAATGISSNDLLQWCKNHPKLKEIEIHWPYKLNHFRQKLGVSAPPGGPRPKSKVGTIYRVLSKSGKSFSR